MLYNIKLDGFKSIKSMNMNLKPLNVLIGANGAGKSNFISFFKMLNYAMSGYLQGYIGESGGADSLLHYGSRYTPKLTATLHFDTKSGENIYYLCLTSAAQDTLIFTDEAISFTKKGTVKAPLVSLGAGHKESELINLIEGKSRAKTTKINIKTAKVIKAIMERWRVYHFHDTSAQAKIKKIGYIHDNYYLRSDAGNLAAFLYMLKETKVDYYKRIVSTIRLMAPFFDDFVLQPSRYNENNILLNWREKDSPPESIFGPHQLSDGTLRMMALVTLLLQPDLPELIIVDEPELGLHPYAINVLASLLKTVSAKTQIIVSTQSVSLVDQLDPEDFIVVDREITAEGYKSVFRRLSRDDLQEWLDEYTLGQLWEKNVLGGRPSR
ncbi:AAA family ATPase [Desulforamulus ferrireducens]|uniref:Chromosome segregation protein SMC n=1 Tax=Desulforamulus ferrireducens TaxID=1833852 RepID=A0A1S6IWN5_9FIRM|nr:AAA family ATPase [Desulforamulus ferrireducens]AQS59183.1 chromosome segregation protein SMC [Desulforamulus ferrireducens]